MMSVRKGTATRRTASTRKTRRSNNQPGSESKQRSLQSSTASTVSSTETPHSLHGTLNRIEARARDARRRTKEHQTLEAELESRAPTLAELEAELAAQQSSGPGGKKRGGTPSLELVRRAELRLIEQEQLGLFDCQPLEARNEFPTLLARLPVFPPIERQKQKALLDRDNALPFETPFGSGRRHGPPVTIDDEDRLIALMRLRKKRIVGQGSRLPIPLTGAQYTPNGNGDLHVHWVCCTISQIHEEMNICDSGENYTTTLDSLKRLNAIVLEIETNKHDLYFGSSRKGTGFKLVDLVWEAFHNQGLIVAQFSPLVAVWLERQATYLNWEVRRELRGRNARALHRFLSTQPKHYCREMLYIAHAISWEGEKRRMKKPFQAVLDRLVELGWLERYEITGTGRKRPYVVEIWRA